MPLTAGLEEGKESSIPGSFHAAEYLNLEVLPPPVDQWLPQNLSTSFFQDVLLGHSLGGVCDRMAFGFTQTCSFWLCSKSLIQRVWGLLRSLPEFIVLTCRLHKDVVMAST